MIRRIIAIAAVFLATGLGIYTAITVYDKSLSWERMWETPAVSPHEEPIPAMADGVVPFSGGEELLRATAPERLSAPYGRANATAVRSGEIRYGYYCDHCHGRDHDGMAAVGQSFSPLPTDLRSRRVQSMSPGEIFRIISYGLPEGGRQPALQATITAQHRWHIVSYIRSLGVRDPE